jgi:hypothetical protein
MITKIEDLADLMRYFTLLHPDTLVDVFERPDDEDEVHTYAAIGTYRASMADNRIFSGCVREAINHFNELKTA